MLVSCSGNSLYRSLRDAQVPICLRNELRVMQSLLATVRQLLAAYPTSYEEDGDRLQSDEFAPFSNERHALIQIRGEKEVLHFFEDFAVTTIELLSCADMDLFEEMLEVVRRTKNAVIYMHAKLTLGRLHQDEARRADMRRRKWDLSRPTVV
jgi:hypothetical protein